MTERWLPIEGYDGYEVSNLGRVRCWRPRPHNAEPPTEPRILKPQRGTNGYQKVVLGFKGPTKYTHNLVADAFVVGKADGLEVAHENGIRHDNRASNLVWKTRKENHRDKVRHGTYGRTLTAEAVESIRAEYIPGSTTQKELAMKYGITQATVSKVVRGQTWAVSA